MKKIVAICLLFVLGISLTGCLKDNISNDLQGEWRLLGWDVDGYFHEVDSFKVEYHKFSIEFSGNNVKAYSLGNVTDFGKVRSKNNTLIKESAIQTQVFVIDDESIFFDKNIVNMNRYELIGNKLKIYFSDNDYFLFTNQFTNNIKPSCNCDQNIVMTVKDEQGTIHKDKYLRKWYIAYNYPGSNVTIIRYYPESFPDIDFLQEDLKVVFSGDAYNMDINWGDYQSEQVAGMEYYCMDLLKIEKQDK